VRPSYLSEKKEAIVWEIIDDQNGPELFWERATTNVKGAL